MALFEYAGPGPAYDVVICGGGLAGATLARQLKLNLPDVSVLVLDRVKYPVPEAAYKVGESTVELAGFYFAESLQLKSHMDRYHLPKHGLRYFFHSFHKNFSDRPEMGLSAYAPFRSYQIDRGMLENSLFRMNVEGGIEVLEDVRVQEIELGCDAAWHEVSYLDGNDQEHRVRGRWMIDAMGRRRYLQTKLGLKKEVPDGYNAVWFRVKGRVDLEDFVPDSESAWHARVPGRLRYNSTNHLMGKGYWVWLIPLGSGNTSVGIVTDARFHDFSTMDTLEKSFDWLEKNEPTVLAHVRDREFMDFLGFRHFNYSSKQAFSMDRWACVGEAAAFSDPFYSPGSNMIGFENTMVTHLIGEDKAGRLRKTQVGFFNEFVLSLNDWLDYNIHTAYAYFGDPMVFSLAYLWDTATGWGIACPQMFNSIYLNDECAAAVRGAVRQYYALALRVKNLFNQWGERSRGRFSYDFIDYYNISFIREIYNRNLVKGKSREELVEDHRATMERLEEFAQVIFLIAVQDTMPEKMGMLAERQWLNAWGIGLDDAKWEADGLFRPKTAPRSLEPILSQIRQLYKETASAQSANEMAAGVTA